MSSSLSLQADVDGNGYLESKEVGRILARKNVRGRGVTGAEVRAVMRQVRMSRACACCVSPSLP